PTTRWFCSEAWPTPTSCGRCQPQWTSPGRCSVPASPPRYLPRPVDPGGGGPGARPDAHVMAQPADRHPQRRREPGDAKVQVCTSGPNVLITNRKPDDLPAFCKQLRGEFQRQV